MQNSGYLGGDVSMTERHRLRDKYLKPLSDFAKDQGYKNQCRCGGTIYVRWRARWYCTRCARFIRALKSGGTMMSQIEAGQIWMEVDPRRERHTRVLNVSKDREVIVIETVIRSSDGWKHKPKSPAWTYAAVERFNGKRGGYELIATGALSSPSSRNSRHER